MALTMADIPSVDVPPVTGRQPSRVGQALHTSAARRSVLRFVAGSGMALGLSVVSWLPPLRKAHAAWDSRYEEHKDCAGFFNPGTTCTPPSWYISPELCNGVHFHRDDHVYGVCFTAAHSVQLTSCRGRNAWQWNGTRCSDGRYSYQDCGGAFRTTSSICRNTAI